MKKKTIKIALFIIFINFLFIKTYSKELKTSQGIFKLNKYDVAIVGNSHASFMSHFIGIDNDLESMYVGNHSVTGDDLESLGNKNKIYSSNKENKKLIAEENELKGWINEFIDEANEYEYAICWFGSNSTVHSPEYFKNIYLKWINEVKKINPNCKLIIMQIPYLKYEDKETNILHFDSTIDIYNNIIKEVVDSYDENVYFKELPEKIKYHDKAHLSKETYKKIWNEIKSIYNIE